MKHLYKMLAVLLLLLNFGAAQAQYSVGIVIDSTGALSGISGIEATFGSRLHYDFDFATGGEIVDVKDIMGNATACDSIAEDLTGKIALINRGTCGFVQKCLNAAKKGASMIWVANNATGVGTMGTGTDPVIVALSKTINVPCLMISQATGVALRSELAKVSMVSIMWHPNNYSNDAYAITAGKTYLKAPLEEHLFADTTSLLFPIIGAVDSLNAKDAAYFLYAPTKSGKISVSSCDGKGDTNLGVYESEFPDAFLRDGEFVKEWHNEGVCPKDAADPKNLAAALTDIPVEAGKYYYIEFNDQNSADSFAFILNFVKADSVDVTFSVDMKSEATIDSLGVYVAGSFQGWDPAKTKMDNVAGTKIYEKKIRIASDQTIEYKFVNGNAWGKDESVAGACSASASGFGNRKLVVATENITFASAPCFKSCEVCINPKADLNCDAAAVICDPFKSYANGNLPNGTAAHWTTWDEAAAAGLANISSDEFASDTKALRIDGSLAPTQDVVFQTTNLTKGHYNLNWKMFIPTRTVGTTKRKHAYYNIQKDLTGNHVFSAEVSFLSNGNFRYQIGTAIAGAGTFEADKWFNISHDIDIDKDTIIVSLGNTKLGWKWSLTSTAGVENKQLAGINFYADSTFSKYYVDDIQFIKLPDPKAKVTFSVDMANQTVDPAKGVCVAGSFQKAAGYANDWTPGITKLVNKPNTTLWELTVELPIGKYAYKFINDDKWDGKEEKGVGCAAGGDDRQFEVASLADVKAGTFCYGKCYTCNLRAVTFFLDLTKEASVAPSQVTMAGSFQDEIGQGVDWTPGVIFLKRVAGRLYSTTLGIPAGSYEYKFLNGLILSTGETVKGACAVGATGNRALVIGALDTKLDTVCFKHCVTCAKVIATNDPKFDASLSLYPNPTQDIVNLNYEFNAITTLKVNVMNTLGQTVYSVEMPQITAGSAVLDVHNLVSGTYMMQITDENNRQTVKRFVIER